ncbi:MAG: GUN4 domain-containing protein [Oscillatoriales cyanobacterium]|nr:MAG: GUN4 domain-containing protein [Oscillatoriales cyanobacterium]
MSDFSASAVIEPSTPLDSLVAALQSGNLKKQLVALPELAAIDDGVILLIDLAKDRSPQPLTIDTIDPLLGRLCQLLARSPLPQARNFLEGYYPDGLVELPSDCKVDYQPIQAALIAEDFDGADRLTIQKLCELAGPEAAKRKWLYFTEVGRFPTVDLQAIDALWRTYSEEKFGFSIQREIWLGVGRDWEKFWPKINWKQGNHWTRWPGEFTWNLTAPRGHLPTTNQLRGVRVMNALMNHPAWS